MVSGRKFKGSKAATPIPVKTPSDRLELAFRRANRRIRNGGKTETEPSDRLIKTLSLVIRSGSYPDVACRAIGISEYLFKTWFEKGIEGILLHKPSQYTKFVFCIDAADAQTEAANIALISEHCNNWQALAWLSERRYSKRWGPKMTAMFNSVEDRLGVGKPGDTLIGVDQGAEVLAILEKYGALPDPQETVIDLSTGEVAESADPVPDTPELIGEPIQEPPTKKGGKPSKTKQSRSRSQRSPSLGKAKGKKVRH